MMTLHQLAKLVGAELTAPEADQPSAELTRVSHLEAASSDAIVFASDARTLTSALASPAGAILAAAKLFPAAAANDSRLIYVTDARYAFALAASHLQAQPTESEVHPTAVLGKGVTLGKATTIGPHAVLGDGVHIGNHCAIGAHVTLYTGTTLGDHVVVQAGAVLGATGFGYACHADTGEYLLFPQQGTLVIEDHVDIGATTTIDRGALGETRIGRGTKIDNLVHIGHNCTIGRNVVIAAQTGISGSSVVEDGAILGGQVGIGEHATVGRGVILGGGAGVLSGKKMHGPNQVFWGRPARPLKEYLRDLARLRGGRKGSEA
ncbi:UDP-3-O-(3-hydroxymyristoyl)glucosamine N-acyltransferase [Granulicella arctica]|uniref:UDP-3-O-[3-hydroxymyristoyl] glucosamine N-acyltransferase n=1 Tax=Granulicella arctica TaxID=940613 RepID=A0A7Y9PH42_9BACT|nr:UDP-3-O-(3-hydroxymyristoyl)glucosamine N-acyltransferase [Granulicella arctica]NYF79790.1 UDP-3-O-[3-hydroxymyristoyl] glucosamine N-acyltransferase [Granulicella arctica]